jgi:hypothetical protein
MPSHLSPVSPGIGDGRIMQIGRTVTPPGRLRCQSRRGRQELFIPTGAVNGLIERELRAFVASDTFADVWVGVNTRAQQTVVRVL